jgi:cold shock CspA family protein
VERPANLDTIENSATPGPMRGRISELKHLSAGTDVTSTHLVSALNSVGYGYIRTADGGVFFDASAVTNVRFDQLKRDMTVEFTLDPGSFLRTSRITVIVAEPRL